MQNNQLSGTIPVELGDLSNLEFMSLQSNQLSGMIPAELGGLSNLEILTLGGNQLSGTIPVELGDLSNLKELRLAGNQLSGTIPVVLGDLSNLEFLILFNNQLSGSIPVELGDLSNLKRLMLSINQLSGTIPPELGDLANLNELWLNDNQLSGCFPASFSAFCNINANLYNNSGLPDGGSADAFNHFCNTGEGVDGDFDTYCSGYYGDDCDDDNATIFPGATEICDGEDNNCDGNTDEGFTDTDNDGEADCVDDDDDGDGVLDSNDNCPLDANADQADGDTDGLGDICDAVFNIDVVTANTILYIEGLGLNNGNTNALTGKLEDALEKYCDGKTNQALNKLNAFKSQVADLELDGVLTAAQAAFLTAAADTMIAAINDGTAECPPVGSNLVVNPNHGNHMAVGHLQLALFPNPATNRVNVRMGIPNGEKAALAIFDHLGREVLLKKLNESEDSFQLNLPSEQFAPGVYYVRAVAGGEVLTERLVISR